MNRVTVEELVRGVDVETLGDEQLKRLAELRGEELRLRADGGIWYYEPQVHINAITKKDEYQDAFHRSIKRIRWVFGGNKSAKSYPTKAEDTMWLLCDHPYRKIERKDTRGWIVSVDFPSSKDVSERLIAGFMPKSRILAWDTTRGRLKVKNNNRGVSELTFKSCESGVEKFQGADLDFIDFDEEPPFDIYKECLARLLIRSGSMWCAETPTLGMTWTFDEFYDRYITGRLDPNVEVFIFDTYWNKYAKREDIELLEKMYDDETKEMRLHGKCIQLTGLVYKEFDRTRHILPSANFTIPSNWRRFRTIDAGINNPTACLWVAVSPEGEYIVYDEYYVSGRTVKENAETIKAQTGGQRIEWTTIDPSTQNRDPISGTSIFNEYRDNGIFCRALREDKSSGINTIRQLLRGNNDQKGIATPGRPRLYFLDTCYETVKEITRYKWKDYRVRGNRNKPEEPQKLNDHALDALRYLVMSRPELSFQGDEQEPEVLNWYS